MDSEEITYLKQEDISDVIAEGLAQLYINDPKYPVDFLGRWFLNHCNKQKNYLEL